MSSDKTKLKTIASLETADELIYPFALQVVDDVVVYAHKMHTEIVKLKKDLCTRQSRIGLASIKTDKPVVHIKLPVDDKAVFESADWREKNEMMVENPYLLPTCTLKNTHNLRSRLTDDGTMLATLTNAGIIDLYTYDMHNHQMHKLPHDLNKIQNPKAFEGTIKKFSVLEESLSSVMFTYFEWCPLKFSNFKLLLTVTRSEVISIFKIQEDKATQIFQQVVEDVHKCHIKWTYSKKRNHELYIGGYNGNLRHFSFKFQKDKIQSFKELEVLKGVVKVPPSFIYVDFHGEDPIIFCVKGHSIDVFYKKKTISFYVALNVTGLVKIDELHYLASSLNNSIISIKLQEENHQLKLLKKEPCEITKASEDEVPQESTKMTYYGIATSRNKIFIYVACSLYHHTDHLIIKQPAFFFVNLLLNNDPSVMLKNNSSLSLTNFADCIEAFKMQALTNISHLEPIEEMSYELVMSLSFLYYLKLQLVTVVNIKLLYYSTRSQKVVDNCKQSRILLMDLIQVVNTFFYLKELVKSSKLNELNLRAIRAMREFLMAYSRKEIFVSPFKEASERFRDDILSLVVECKKLKQAPLEICEHCDGSISSDDACINGHQVIRCAITRLPISVESKNYCSKCIVSVTSEENLKNLFGESFECVCPFCDEYLTFEE